ncbi:CARDB domain-containing protein [Corallococcus sp. EGB]|uniref:CARDB domain-containing protein n=1 Tax=Corallococcus sp. EGB TaxID=1521117 RepID=UPI001CBB17DF|nr:CARDB domain-containing protein [Corallococcus sp. EGB]
MTPAQAAIGVTTVTAPATIPNPNSIFTVTYALNGSSTLASAQMRFYLATSPQGTSNRVLMSSQQILLGRAGTGLYLPPAGTQSASFSRATVQAAAQTVLDQAAAACAPQLYYIQVEADLSSRWGDDTLIGTTKLPDFYFTAGTLTPSTITPGGTVTFTADLFTACPVNAPSTIGVFLADANFNLLSYIGGISVGTGAGTFSVAPTAITFSTAIEPGTYYLVLVADVDGVIAESNENNNQGAFTLQVVASQPLTVRDSASALESDLPGPVRADIEQYAPTIGFVDGYASLSR